jgi:hypothetical protein
LNFASVFAAAVALADVCFCRHPERSEGPREAQLNTAVQTISTRTSPVVAFLNLSAGEPAPRFCFTYFLRPPTEKPSHFKEGSFNLY